MGNPNFLLDKLETRLGVDEEEPRMRNGQCVSLRRHLITLSLPQEAILREAAKLRGIPDEGYNQLSYITYATLAFASYDTGNDLFETISGHPFPYWHEARARLLEDTARRQRGQWGILGLGDHHERRS